MPQLTVHTKIYAPLGKVRLAYITPTDIMGRNFASDDWCCPSVSNDFRIGGKNTARMEAKNGSSGFDFTTIYDDIVEHQKIAATMEDGRTMTTLFQEDGSCGCVSVTTTFDAEIIHSLKMQQAGRQAILDNFKKYVEEK